MAISTGKTRPTSGIRDDIEAGPDDSIYTFTDVFGTDPDNPESGLIEDLLGNDTLDASAFTTSLTLDLRPTSTFTINDVEISFGADTVIENVKGGLGDDIIQGNQYDNLIEGGDGADEINSGYGNDDVRGDDADDFIRGGEGDDILRGNAGDDILSGEGGDDIVNGGNDNDTIYGGIGEDRLSGGGGDDKLIGGADNDKLLGGEGDDFLQGIWGDDVLDGGAGDDILYGDSGIDTVLLTGSQSDYTYVELETGEVEVTSIATGEVDTLRDIEFIKFDEASTPTDLLDLLAT